MQAMDHEKQLRRKFNLVHFLGIQRLYQQSLEEQQDDTLEDKKDDNVECIGLKRILDDIGTSAYKQKLIHFSKRIDTWHEK